MNALRIGEQTKTNAVHWCVAPALVEETARSVEMLEVCLVLLRTPEVHIRDLEIAPEMTGRITVSLVIVHRPSLLVSQPVKRVRLRERMFVVGQEIEGFRPETCNRLWTVVQSDREAVGFVVIAHVAEDIVVNIAEEMHVRLHTPVVLHVEQSRVLVEHAAIPAAHLVVALHACVLHALIGEQLRALLHHISVDPRWDLPVLFWDDLVGNLGLGVFPCFSLEFLGERDVVDESPRVVEFTVPGSLQVLHGLDQLAKLFVAHQRK